jgi:predicted metalloprotease
MSLPHLDQIIELERGEPGQLWTAVAECGQRNTLRLLMRPGTGFRVDSAGVVVALATLNKVAKRLKKLDEKELSHVGIPSSKPKKFRLKVEEVVAIMLYVWPHATSGHYVLNKVHQKSLNLEPYIRF